MWFTKARRAQSNDDFETWIGSGVSPTLNAFDNATETRATVLIIDGTRVGDVRVYEDQVMQTVIQRWGTGGGNVPAIFPIQGTVIGRSDTAGPQGKGYGEDGDPMFTLDRVSGHAVAFHTKQDPINGEVSPALGTSSQGMGVHHESVRRLTPTECERLQGFPDGWTDGQADSHRYKQLGNAVAVPVVEWLINRTIERQENAPA
jgi:DNA (cytosine-5)-methyltransferase 1